MKKKALALLALFGATSAMAEAVIYGYSPDEVHTLSDLITYLSFFFQRGTTSGDAYFSLLRFLVIFGTLIVVVRMAAAVNKGAGQAHQGIFDFVKYQIFFIGMLMIMFAKYENIIVKDEQSGTTGVTAEVPVLFAETMSFFSKFRKVMTEISEYAYRDIRNPPAAAWDLIPYGMSGLGYGGMPDALSGAGLLSLKDVDKHSFNGHQIAPMFSTLLTECVVTPLASSGTSAYLPSDLYRSRDIMADIEAVFNNNPSFANIPLEHVYYGNDTCGNLWNQIKTDIAAVVNDANNTILKDFRPQRFASALAYVDSLADRTGTTVSATSELISDAAKAKEAIVQTVLANETNSMFAKLGVAGNVYAAGANKTLAETQYTGMGVAVMMQKYLPLLSTMLFAIMIGAFPFIFAFSLLPDGFKSLVNFTKTLAWVSLWAPTAAILGFFVDRRLGDIYEQIAPGLASGSNYMELLRPDMLISDTSAEAAVMAGLAGMLYLSVPGLTWMLVTGSGYMLSNIAGIIGGAFQRSIAPEQVMKDAGDLEAARQASIHSGKKVGIAEMAHFDTMRTAAIAGGQYAGYQLAMQEAGVTTDAFGRASEVSTAAAAAQEISYSRRVALVEAAHIGAVKGAEVAGTDLGHYGDLDAQTAQGAGYKRGLRTAEGTRSYDAHSTIDQAAGAGRVAGEKEAGVDKALSKTYSRPGSAFETAAKSTTDHETKTLKHYEQMTEDDVVTNATAAGTLSGKSAAKLADKIRNAPDMGRMIEEQSLVNAATEFSQYTAASEAADALAKHGKFGMSHGQALGAIAANEHSKAATMLSSAAAGALMRQKIMKSDSILDANQRAAVANARVKTASETTEAMAAEEVSNDVVAEIAQQDTDKGGYGARLGEYANHKVSEKVYQEAIDREEKKLKGLMGKDKWKNSELAKKAKKLRDLENRPNLTEKEQRELEEARKEYGDAVKAEVQAYSAAVHRRDEALKRGDKEAAAKAEAEMREHQNNIRSAAWGFDAAEAEKANEAGIKQTQAEIAALKAEKEKINSTYDRYSHGANTYAKTAQAAAAGEVYMSEGFAPLRNLANFQARTNIQQGELLADRAASSGLTNQQFAQQAAINTVGRVADTAVAAHAMEQAGFLDKTFNRLSVAQQSIVRAHGYSENASAMAKMNALFGATHNYSQWGVHDGYRHSVSYAADTGGFGDDVYRQNRGLFKEAGYYVDTVGQVSYQLVGGQNVAVQELYAGGAGVVKDVADLVGLKGLFRAFVKNASRKASANARRAWFRNTMRYMREIRSGEGGRESVTKGNSPEAILVGHPE